MKPIIITAILFGTAIAVFVASKLYSFLEMVQR